jgi:hypothetical protein
MPAPRRSSSRTVARSVLGLPKAPPVPTVVIMSRTAGWPRTTPSVSAATVSVRSSGVPGGISTRTATWPASTGETKLKEINGKITPRLATSRAATTRVPVARSSTNPSAFA